MRHLDILKEQTVTVSYSHPNLSQSWTITLML